MSSIALDYSWFEDALADVESSATSVVTVQTGDPKREQQVEVYLGSRQRIAFYAYNPWNGLQQWEPGQGAFAACQSAAAPGYDDGLRNDLRDLAGALHHMDRVLRERRAVLLLRGIDRPDTQLDAHLPLIHALRAWAADPEIVARKSFVVVITADPSRVMDAATLELTALAQPALATDEERLQIVTAHTQGAARLSDDQLRALALATAGLTLKQTEAVLLKTYHTQRNFDVDRVKHYKANHIRRTDVLEIEEPAVSFDDVGGYDAVKRIVRETLANALRNRQRAEMAALDLPRGILFYGPPGTGKTLFAKAMARETGLPFINLRTENLFTRWLGESGQRVRDAIRLIEQASPALVFIDEIDRFGRRGGGGEDGASQEIGRVFAQMLEWLGDPNRKSIIVGTTNVPEHLDKAFVRPGRFSKIVPFLYPNAEARLRILALHLGMAGVRRRPVLDAESVGQALPHIAQHSELYTGADLEEVVKAAKSMFFSSDEPVLTGIHLLAAHRDYRVSTAERKATLQHYRQLGPEFANSMALLDEYENRA